jgi:hypothetical protein
MKYAFFDSPQAQAMAHSAWVWTLGWLLACVLFSPSAGAMNAPVLAIPVAASHWHSVAIQRSKKAQRH